MAFFVTTNDPIGARCGQSSAGVFDNFWRWTVLDASGPFLVLHLRTVSVLFWAVNRTGHYFLGLCPGWISPFLHGAFRPALDEGFCDRVVHILLYCGLSRFLFFQALLRFNAAGSESASRGSLHAGAAKAPGSSRWTSGSSFANCHFRRRLRNSARKEFVVLTLKNRF
jgi:hypothetical protein